MAWLGQGHAALVPYCVDGVQAARGSIRWPAVPRLCKQFLSKFGDWNRDDVVSTAPIFNGNVFGDDVLY